MVYTVSYLVSFAIMIFLNYWSATEVGIVANQDQSIIQPAGYTFSIWGVIYVLLFVWLIYLFVSKESRKNIVERVTFWPVINFLLNGAWIVAFTGEQIGLSVGIIVCLLLTLIILYEKLFTPEKHKFNQYVFSVYFSWVTVATIVNFFAWFRQQNITGFLGMEELTWAIIMISVATVVAGFLSYQYVDYIYPLVFVWSYLGILAANGFTYFIFALLLLICIAAQVTFSLMVLITKK